MERGELAPPVFLYTAPVSNPRPIFLVGMMGAGKSTVGPRLAARLGRAFVDTDQEIERRTGRTIAEIFAGDGEPRFRALEREAIESASDEAAGRGPRRRGDRPAGSPRAIADTGHCSSTSTPRSSVCSSGSERRRAGPFSRGSRGGAAREARGLLEARQGPYAAGRPPRRRVGVARGGRRADHVPAARARDAPAGSGGSARRAREAGASR